MVIIVVEFKLYTFVSKQVNLNNLHFEKIVDCVLIEGKPVLIKD